MDFVRGHPGEPLPEETLKHSPTHTYRGHQLVAHEMCESIICVRSVIALIGRTAGFLLYMSIRQIRI